MAHIADEKYQESQFACMVPNGGLVNIGVPIESQDVFKSEYLNNQCIQPIVSLPSATD